jgi:hypothetical protein
VQIMLVAKVADEPAAAHPAPAAKKPPKSMKKH